MHIMVMLLILFSVLEPGHHHGSCPGRCHALAAPGPARALSGPRRLQRNVSAGAGAIMAAPLRFCKHNYITLPSV